MSDHKKMEIEGLSDDDLESVSGGVTNTTSGNCETTSGYCNTSLGASCTTSGGGTCRNVEMIAASEN